MRKRRGARRVFRFGLPLACALVAAAPGPGAMAALKAEVVPSADGKGAGTLRITGAAAADSVYLDYKDKVYKVSQAASGPGTEVTPGAGCEQAKDANGVPLTRLECAGDRDRIYVDLGEGDNFLQAFRTPDSPAGHLPFTYIGRGGPDTVMLGQFTLDFVNAGGGNDSVHAGGSAGSKPDQAEKLIGGPGNDTLVGEAGRDLIDGGPGQDLMYGDGQFGEQAHLDGEDHIDAADAGDTENDKHPIDCGGKDDTYQKDKNDIVALVEVRNCETEKQVTVELEGVGDPAAGAQPDKPKPEEKVQVEVEAEKKAAAKVKGKLVIPGELGEEPKTKPKLAPPFLAPSLAVSARRRVVPIKTKKINLSPAVERFLSLSLSPRNQRAVRRSLERGFVPTLTVSVEAQSKKGKKRNRTDTATIAYGL